MQTMKPKQHDPSDQAAIDAFLAKKQVNVVPTNLRTVQGKDWKRLIRGQKVATEAEITAERDRRALIAITNKDLPLVEKLLTGGFDHEIKFDIENNRVGPSGEIR